MKLFARLFRPQKQVSLFKTSNDQGNDATLAARFDALLRCESLLADIRQHAAGLMTVGRESGAPTVSEATRILNHVVSQAIAQVDLAKGEVRRHLGRRFHGPDAGDPPRGGTPPPHGSGVGA